jgi:hypothetical protein
LADLKTLTVKEFVGRLRAVDERYELDGGGSHGGRLLLTKEEWVARVKHREQENANKGSTSGSSSKSNKGHGKKQSPNKEGTSSSGGHDRSKVKCVGNNSTFRFNLI